MDAVDLVSMVVLDGNNDIPAYSIRGGVISYNNTLFEVVIGAGCRGCHFDNLGGCPLTPSNECVFSKGRVARMIRGKH